MYDSHFWCGGRRVRVHNGHRCNLQMFGPHRRRRAKMAIQCTQFAWFRRIAVRCLSIAGIGRPYIHLVRLENWLRTGSAHSFSKPARLACVFANYLRHLLLYVVHRATCLSHGYLCTGWQQTGWQQTGRVQLIYIGQFAQRLQRQPAGLAAAKRALRAEL